jgi:hypothetical protein
MSIFSRKNAVIGWAALFVGKRVLKRKAKAAAARSVDAGARRPRPKVLAAMIAAAVGVAAFFRRRGRRDDST